LIRIQLKEAVRGRKRDLTPDEQRSHESYPTLYTRDFAFAYDPTNRFSFEIENYSDTNRKWTDTKNQKIEEKTEQIAHALRAVAAFEKRRRTERELERQREEKEQHRRMKQQERIQRLRSNSALWEEAERIRAYLAAVRRRAESEDGGLKEGSLKSRFLAWGHRYADSLDPSGNPAAADWSEEF
jgi:hypothetical protein